MDWIVAAALVAFLFWGLFYSYSQSSCGRSSWSRARSGLARAADGVLLLACAVVVAVGAAAYAAQAIEGRSAREATSGRSRPVTVTLDAFAERPIAGVGVGGQPRASAELAGRRSPGRTRRTRRR